jgi:membrane associated rhomboid family serine protease
MTFYKIAGWVGAILGAIAFLGGLMDEDIYAVVGGALFVTLGGIIIHLLTLIEKKK